MKTKSQSNLVMLVVGEVDRCKDGNVLAQRLIKAGSARTSLKKIRSGCVSNFINCVGVE